MRPSRLSDRPGRRSVRFSLALLLNPRGDGGSFVDDDVKEMRVRGAVFD
jgi:hypothetical protein